MVRNVSSGGGAVWAGLAPCSRSASITAAEQAAPGSAGRVEPTCRFLIKYLYAAEIADPRRKCMEVVRELTS